MHYRLTKEADLDLEKIYIEGIERFGEAQAFKYQSTIRRLLETLASMPTIGRKSERGNDGELRFPHGVHIIYYRQIEEGIEIVRFINGRDVTDLWGEL